MYCKFKVKFAVVVDGVMYVQVYILYPKYNFNV